MSGHDHLLLERMWIMSTKRTDGAARAKLRRTTLTANYRADCPLPIANPSYHKDTEDLKIPRVSALLIRRDIRLPNKGGRTENPCLHLLGNVFGQIVPPHDTVGSPED